MKRVVVVDDDPAMLSAISYMLSAMDFETIAFASAEALLEPGRLTEMDCALVDVRLGPGMDGLALLTALQLRGTAAPVIIMTGHADVPLAVRAMRAGATNFIEKPFSGDALLALLADALAASTARAATGKEVEEARAAVALLTRREREVLLWLLRGEKNKIVAHRLGISTRTVEVHRASLMARMKCRAFADAVRLAILAGLSDEDIQVQPERDT